MSQLTVRISDDELNSRIQRLARREGISLNSAALKLLRRGATLTKTGDDKDTVGKSLDRFIGTWTKEQADEIDAALRELDAIDQAKRG